jgi:hypothetical protein
MTGISVALADGTTEPSIILTDFHLSGLSSSARLQLTPPSKVAKKQIRKHGTHHLSHQITL